jgi:hypothetical protein
MNSLDGLPSPNRSLWWTLGLAGLFVAAALVAGSLGGKDAAQTALMIGAVPAGVGVIYLLSLWSVRRTAQHLADRCPGALALPVAQTEPLRVALAQLAGRRVLPFAQYAAVTASRDGVFVWPSGKAAHPIAAFDWRDVSEIRIGGAPIDVTPTMAVAKVARVAGAPNFGLISTPAIMVTARSEGRTAEIPLTLYSTKTAYPMSRADFVLTVTAFLHLRALGLQ